MRSLLPLVGAFALAGSVVAFAQENSRPRYTVLPVTVKGTPGPASAVTSLPVFNGAFTFSGVTYHYQMVGTSPSTGTSTTIPAMIIPIKIVVTKGTKTFTFDPQHVLSNGKTVVNNTVASPIFDSTTTYTTPTGVDLGTTQYIDAFQRGNFWSAVQHHTGYHLLLGGPTVLTEQTFNPSASQGTTGNPFGNLTVAEVDINFFDAQVQGLLTSLNIQPNTLPIFIVYDTYLTSGGCCIGGYHSAVVNTNGSQSYSVFSYIDKAGDFAQDVSALSHEIGEWADDPGVKGSFNSVQCGILEVGDPEEGFANFGAFPFTVNGFTYNLQDLTFITYFGAPAHQSVKTQLTFQNNPFGLGVCSNGG
jgi:hypothetical protein